MQISYKGLVGRQEKAIKLQFNLKFCYSIIIICSTQFVARYDDEEEVNEDDDGNDDDDNDDDDDDDDDKKDKAHIAGPPPQL